MKQEFNNDFKTRIHKALGRNKSLDISKITENLYVGSWPKKENIDELKKRNIELIISLIFQKDDKELGEPPFELLSFTTFDTPFTPIPTKHYFTSVEKAKETMQKDKSVLVYCKSGMNRSVAIAAGILVSQGYTSDDALNLIRSKRPVAKARSKTILKPLHEFEKEYNKLYSKK